MTLPFASRITGTGSHFPERRCTNHDLVAEFAKKGIETSHEWIFERTGIGARRLAERGNPDETNSSLGLKAAKNALEMAGKSPLDIDMILYATCSPDTIVPSTACWLQEKLGAKNAWALDINAACSGFLFGVSTADQFIKTGQSKCALVIGAEVLSSFVNWNDRATSILFGDGAGAAIIERTEPNSSHRILSTHMMSDGALADLILVPGGGSASPITKENFDDAPHKLTMKGKEVFKEATRTLAEYATLALETNGFKASDLNWFIPHQANMRIIESVSRRLGLPLERVLINIEEFGNTSAATVPTVLDQSVRNRKIKSGDLVLMDVFGAGLTYGSILLRW